MGETFRMSGTVAPGTYVAITPPTNKLYLIGQGTTVLNGQLRLAYRNLTSDPNSTFLSDGNSGFTKPFFPVTSGAALTGPAYPIMYYESSPTEAGNLNGVEDLYIVNDGATTGYYCITGPVSTLADEGIESARTFGIWSALGGTSWLAGTTMPAGYAYLVNQVFSGANVSVSVCTSDGTFIMWLPCNGARFWLWSEMQLKFRVVVNGSNQGGGLRVTRYAETASLEEYANRLSYNQVLAGGAYVDLVPPADETWYIDLHNWYTIGGQVLWNGTTQETSGVVHRFQLSSANWLRFKNQSSSSNRLFITGTKIKD